MPTYVYQCDTCGRFEKWQSFSESPLTSCPTCEEPVRRVITPAPIVFKGSGWYSTDSKGGSSKTIAGSGDKKADEKATDTAAETPKTETAETAKTETPKAETASAGGS